MTPESITSQPSEAAKNPEPATSLGCTFCGRPEAHLFAGQFICDDCYIAKGSCCAGDE